MNTDRARPGRPSGARTATVLAAALTALLSPAALPPATAGAATATAPVAAGGPLRSASEDAEESAGDRDSRAGGEAGSEGRGTSEAMSGSSSDESSDDGERSSDGETDSGSSAGGSATPGDAAKDSGDAGEPDGAKDPEPATGATPPAGSAAGSVPAEMPAGVPDEVPPPSAAPVVPGPVTGPAAKAAYQVTVEPGDRTAQVGETVDFTVKYSRMPGAAAVPAGVEGALEVEVRWQYAAGPDGQWTDVSGSGGGGLRVTVVAGMDGTRFRAAVTAADGTATSEPAVLHVPAPAYYGTVSDPTIDLGREQTAVGHNFVPGTLVKVTLQPGGVDLGTVKTAADGTVTTRFDTMGMLAGDHTVVWTAQAP